MPLIVPDQQARNRCITDLDSNLVVEAAAGTGKTTLMSCRVAMLLAAGREPSTIAAISFTEASASELGKRIHGVVEELLADRVPIELRAALPSGLSDSQKQSLSAAADRLDELTTTTIHSFCQQIIVGNAVEAGLDPGIKVADEMTADTMFDQAFSDWLANALSSGSATDRAVVVLAEDDPLQVERELRDLARMRRQYRRAAPPAPDLSQRPDIELTDAIDAFARWVADHPLDKRTNDLASEFDRLRVHYDGTLAVEVTFDTLWRMAHPPRVSAMKWKTFDFEAYQRLGVWKKAAGEDGVRLNDEATTLYNSVRTSLLSLLAHVGSCMIWQLSRSMQPALDDYDDIKQRAAVMDFDDLLGHARNLVMKNPRVRNNVAAQYRHILVDECQDTDILQVEILVAIAAEQPVSDWRDAQLRPGALFLVGDPKQSIYRFRNADIAAYRAARDKVVSEPNGALVEITANFRSRRAIVDFVNANFVDVFDGNGQPGYVQLQSTVEDSETSTPDVVRLTIGVEGESPAELRRMEAAAVGALCEHMIGRLPIRESNGSVRPARAGDIALLAASHTELWRYEQELERRRIAVASQAGKALMRRQETQDVLALLRTLSDPTDKLAFGALLRGPLVGLTDHELLDIVADLGEWENGRPPDLSLFIDASRISHHYARSTVEILQSLRHRASVVTPSQLLAEAIEALLVRPVLAARHGNRSARAITNLDALVQMGTRHSVFGLASFIEDLQQQWERTETVQEGRSDSVEDAVQIVTMHNCKGLEWPIIIPVGTATNFRGPSQFVYQPAHNSLHWVIGGVAPASLGEARVEEERQQGYERRRMWYVACTRARDLLVVPYLPTSRENSWFRAVRLDKVELTEIDLSSLPDKAIEEIDASTNEQSAALYAQQAQVVSQSAPPLRWRQPSLHESDRAAPLFDQPPPSELAEQREVPTGAGPLRGTLLHKLMEEIIDGDLSLEPEALFGRTQELLDQLLSQSPDVEVVAPDPTEMVATIRSTLAIPEVAMMLPYLEPEVAVWHDGGETLLAGRVDALVLSGEQVLGVVDWKSDIAPSAGTKAMYVGQVSDYLQVTGAVAGAVVFVSSGEITWVGDRQLLFSRLTPPHS